MGFWLCRLPSICFHRPHVITVTVLTWLFGYISKLFISCFWVCEFFFFFSYCYGTWLCTVFVFFLGCFSSITLWAICLLSSQNNESVKEKKILWAMSNGLIIFLLYYYSIPPTTTFFFSFFSHCLFLFSWKEKY